MDKAILKFTLLFALSLLGDLSSAQGQFHIYRTNKSPTDFFTIPSSICNARNYSSTCTKTYNSQGSKRTSCSCLCGYRDSFLYQHGRWQCTPDSNMTQKQGCGFRFARGVPKLKQVQARTLYVPKNQPRNCQVDESRSKYLTCAGVWKPVKSQTSSKSQFKLIYVKPLSSQTKYELHVNVTAGVPDLRGRIVNLVLKCKPKTGNPCLLFKIRGEIKCPVDPNKPTSTSTSQPTIQPSTNTPSVSENEAPRPTNRQFSTKDGRNVTKPDQEARRADFISSNIGFIAGGVAGFVAFLIILSCIVVFCVRKRKQRILRKNFYKVNVPPTPPLNNADRGEKVPLEKMNFRYIPAQANPIYEGIPEDKLEMSKVQEPQYMNLNFRGGIKVGIHGPAPVKPARNSLKRESNKAKAARNVNNAIYKSDSGTIPVEPTISTTEDETQRQPQDKKENKDDTHIYMNEKEDDVDCADGEDEEWDSFSEGDIAENEKQALQQKKKPDEVIYATINDVATNNFANEVMASFMQLDKK